MKPVLDLLRAHWPTAAALVLGILIGWQLFHPRQAAVHEKADEHVTASAAARVDTTAKTGPETITTVEEEFAPLPNVEAPSIPRADTARGATPMGVQPPPAAQGETLARNGVLVKRTVTVDRRGPTIIETHATEQAQATEDRHLDLTIKPEAATWRVQVGFENVLRAREVRLAVSRQIFGPVWVEASAVPFQRSLGVAVAVQW